MGVFFCVCVCVKMFPCQFICRLKKSFQSDMSTFIPTNGGLSLPVGGTTCLSKQQNRGVTGKLAKIVCNLIWVQKQQNQDAVKILRAKSNHFYKNLQILFDTMVIHGSVFGKCLCNLSQTTPHMLPSNNSQEPPRTATVSGFI